MKMEQGREELNQNGAVRLEQPGWSRVDPRSIGSSYRTDARAIFSLIHIVR